MILAVLSLASALSLPASPALRPRASGPPGPAPRCRARCGSAPAAIGWPIRTERGVIIAAASGTHIDLTGVVLESGDSIPSRFVGVGVASRGVDAVTITGGAIRGYRYGVRLEGGRAHRVTGTDLSGSRNQGVRSTPARPDSTDRLELHPAGRLRALRRGILLQRTVAASVTGITARGAQNGIALVEVRDSYVADNDRGLQ